MSSSSSSQACSSSSHIMGSWLMCGQQHLVRGDWGNMPQGMTAQPIVDDVVGSIPLAGRTDAC